MKDAVKKRVLVVDDNSLDADALKDFLGERGFEVFTAKDRATVAVQMMRDPDFEGIVLDLTAGPSVHAYIVSLENGLDRKLVFTIPQNLVQAKPEMIDHLKQRFKRPVVVKPYAPDKVDEIVDGFKF